LVKIEFAQTFFSRDPVSKASLYNTLQMTPYTVIHTPTPRCPSANAHPPQHPPMTDDNDDNNKNNSNHNNHNDTSTIGFQRFSYCHYYCFKW